MDATLDLVSLRAETQHPEPPDELSGGIGPGDFWDHGWQSLDALLRHTRPDAIEHVLDIGSGLGRFALPLAQVLPERGRYEGLDVAPAYVEWCRDGLGLDPRFRFHLAPVRNSQYNPEGARRPRWYRLPWPADHFSHVVACSLFTHLSGPEAKRYVQQSARVLRPGGLLFATFFLVDGASQALIEAEDTYPVFAHRTRWGYTVDKSSLGRGTAFHRDWLLDTIERSGLQVLAVEEGAWRTHTAGYYQDTVVARRPPG